ncbi:MAG TPA: hypothetical protein PKD91_12915, partial [Bacteroidia bacterium]|nr:hypothetical protein [Bacteroidia bacterium]
MKLKLYSLIRPGINRWLVCLLFLTGLLTTNLFAQTTLIDPAGDGGFNNGSTFGTNGWTIANSAAVNQWVVGSSTVTGMNAPFSGNKAYVSNDAGASNSYNNTIIAVNYFYRDVTIPLGEPYLLYSFNWVCTGESTWDMIQVFVAPTSVTPTPTTTYPGSGLNVTNLVGATFINAYNLQATVQTASGVLVGTPGSTVRIIFGWKDDGSGGSAPGGSVDNISLVSTATLPTITANAGGGLWSSPATWAGGTVPSGTNVSIPAGAVVTVDQITAANNIDIGGTLQWNGTANAMSLTGNLTINPGGKFLPYTTAAGGTTGITVNIGGNLTNNGYANLAVGTTTQTLINFNSAGATLGGSGVFEGDGTRGIIRQLVFQNLNSNSILTSQPLTTFRFAA